MDANFIEEHQFIERYVGGELSEAELNDFEVYMLDNPEVIDSIEAQRILQAARSGEELAAHTKQQKPKRSWQPLAIAAVVMLGVGVVFIQQQQPDVSALVATVPETLVFGAQRGVEELPAMHVSHQGPPLQLLKIDPGPFPGRLYDLRLAAKNGEVVVELNGLSAEAGYIEVVFNRLEVGEYELLLESSNEQVQRLSYRLVVD